MISKQVICTVIFKSKTLYVQKCPSRRRNLVSIEVRPGQVLPEWLYPSSGNGVEFNPKEVIVLGPYSRTCEPSRQSRDSDRAGLAGPSLTVDLGWSFTLASDIIPGTWCHQKDTARHIEPFLCLFTNNTWDPSPRPPPRCSCYQSLFRLLPGASRHKRNVKDLPKSTVNDGLVPALPCHSTESGPRTGIPRSYETAPPPLGPPQGPRHRHTIGS